MTNAVANELGKLFERDLERLGKEIASYSNEENLWMIRSDIANSAGNLALHLCGNLSHFIGAILNQSGYERNRSFEFEGRVTLAELQNEIKKTHEAVIGYLGNVKGEELRKEFPLQPLGHPMTNSEFLFHLYGHFNYHLGQINYHRRLLNLE